MVLAVLEARCGMSFAGRDVFLNIAGGIRITEPAADLAVAAALISSLANVCIPKKSVFFGEISLSGAVRPVNQTALRLRESEKLGFETAFLSKGGSKGGSKGNTKDEKGSQLSQDLGHSDLNIRTISDLAGLISLFKLESSET
jgi:DNA repair protein RadA/Sms